MKRLIKGASYDPNDRSHDHQDPETAKAMLIDASFDRIKLVTAGNSMATRLRQLDPRSPEIIEWERAKQ